VTRRTKIVATLGPASSDADTIRAMVRAGMDVARISLAHTSLADALDLHALVREVTADASRPIGTMVDLPGYGFAKAAKSVKRDWPEMIEGYLLERNNLAMVFVLVDGAIGPTTLDVQMLDWLRYNGVPHTVVATKFDKVKSSKRATRKKELAAGCQLDQGDVVWVSASKGDGIDVLRSLVRNWVG